MSSKRRKPFDGMSGPPAEQGMGGKNRPNTKSKVGERRAARKASGISAQKFYVQTRMAEAAKRGKTVSAKDLRTKFQSGEVTRKGFAAPKKKTGKTGTGSSGTGTGSKAFPDLKADITASNNSRKSYNGMPTKITGKRYSKQGIDTQETAARIKTLSGAESQQRLQKERKQRIRP